MIKIVSYYYPMSFIKQYALVLQQKLSNKSEKESAQQQAVEEYFDYYFSRHPYSKSELYDIVNSRFEPKNTPPPEVIQTLEEQE